MNASDVVIAIITSFVWGLNFVITKVGLESFPPIFFTCLRYTAICFPLVFFTSRQGLPWALIVKVGIFLGALTFTLAFIGISLGVSAGLTSLLMQSQVIFTVAFSSLFLRDRPTGPQIFGLTISLVGLAILVWEFRSTPTLVGLLFVIAGAMCSGIVKIIMKQGGQYDTFRLMIWMSIVPPVPLLLASLAFEHGQIESLSEATPYAWGAVLYNAFVSTIFGFGMQAYLIKRYSPNVVTPFSLLVPVFGLLMGYIFLDETLFPSSLLASLFILLGLAYPHLIKALAGSRQSSGRRPPAARHPPADNDKRLTAATSLHSGDSIRE